MKSLITVFIIVLFTILKSFGQNNFTLDGTIKNNYSGYIYLSYEDKIDSCLIKNNHFIFKGKIKNEIVPASFSFKNKGNTNPNLYLEKTKIFIELTIEDTKVQNDYTLAIINITKATGTKTSKIQEEYENCKNEFQNKNNFYKKMLEKVESIVERNPKNPFSSSILCGLTWNDTLDKTRLKYIYSKLDKSKINKTTKRVIEKNLFPELHVDVNDMIFDFELLDRNNLIYNTKSLKGKWILIDFWASWCGPCRKQLPELKKIYDSNKNSNFEIIGVSIDEDITKWKKALDIENLDWINLNENGGFEGKISIKYNVDQLPMNFLINPEGKIIAKDISAEELIKVLKQI